MIWYRTEFSVTVTEGLSAEVFVETELLAAGNPSVLTADNICVIWTMWKSPNVIVFETSKPCRKPAPFTQGSQELVQASRECA